MVVDTTLNEHRENDPMHVKIRKAMKMIARGIDPSTVAVAYRVEPSTIEIWRTIQQSHPKIMESLSAAKISYQNARVIAQARAADQPIALEKLLALSTESQLPVTGALAVVRAVRKKAPIPGRLPRNAIAQVLADEHLFDPEFIRGIRFSRGELSEEDIRAIMKKVGR